MMKINIFLIFCLICEILCYNIDVENIQELSPKIIQKYDKSPIDFGFSLGLYETEKDIRLIVGAPNAPTNQNANQPGDLFSCSTTSGDPCEALEVDKRKAGDKFSNFIDKDFLDSQRLGTSLSIQNDSVMTCAPNWHYQINMFGIDKTAVVGRCFNSLNGTLDDFGEFSPVFDDKLSPWPPKLDTGAFCQVGISAAHLNNGKVAFGSPGCQTFKGNVYITSKNGTAEDLYKGTLTYENLFPTEQNNEEIKLIYKYLGYSTASGIFDGFSGVAASMPIISTFRNLNNETATGPVILILVLKDGKLQLQDVLHPPNESGDTDWNFSYFGASIAVTSVDEDLNDDVIVGAPNYFDGNKEVGAFIVYKQKLKKNKKAVFELHNLVIGDVEGSRFGAAISAIGDIDGDGYDDIAVGAPYYKEGDVEGGKGAVYIYRGGSNGIQDVPSQIIKRDYYSFGRSIAPKFKINKGLRNDLAIGAPSADKVEVFRSKQVISVEYSVKFKSQFYLNEICNFGGKQRQCKDLGVCASYELIGPEADYFDRLETPIKISVELNQDLTFEYGTSNTYEINPINNGREECIWRKVYTRKELLEFQEFTVRSTLQEFREDMEIILSKEIRKTKVEKLQIVPKCENVVCKSDIELQVDRTGVYELGKGNIKLNINISNLDGDRFYAPALNITSKNLKAEQIEMQMDKLIYQSCQNNACDLTPYTPYLKKNAMIKFQLILSPTNDFWEERVEYEVASFIINLLIEPQKHIIYPSKATKQVKVPIKITPEFKFNKLDPPEFEVSADKGSVNPSIAESLDDIGPQFRHVYQLENESPFPIYTFNFTMYIPAKIGDSYFVYVEDIPAFSKTYLGCRVYGVKIDEFGLNKSKTKHKFVNVQVVLPDEYTRLYDNSIIEKAIWQKIECEFDKLEKYDYGNVTLTARFASENFKKFDDLSIKNLTTVAEGKPWRLPLNQTFTGDKISSHSVTKINYLNATQKNLEWWKILLIVIGSILVIVALMGILYKVGFFKRKNQKPPEEESAPERVPLNERKSVPADISAKQDQVTEPNLEGTECAQEEFMFRAKSRDK